ncbi:MAG: TAT-variant-translocated molybdopterin oxidoreductase, partial [Acidobacteriia bacterium]|nr:TAT-variant-translocated molybdopterin oxidoreductase [Terriglobia bacterium]
MATTNKPTNRIDLASIRARAESEAGKRFWRSLEELAETPEYQAHLAHEFPHDPAKEPGAMNRRDALKLMAASAALAGLTACTKLPPEKIVPYSQQPPEEFIPGKPLFYATAMTLGGVATGLLVESHMGRPTKVEGNPSHPGSLGAADAFAQASVLTLYDPDRSQAVVSIGRISDWSAFLVAMEQHRARLAAQKGAGLRILTETVTSPTLASQIRSLLSQFPAARWHQYEPVSRDAAREGARLAFGESVNTVYRLDQADVVVALDSDFLCSGPGSLHYARDFADRRRMPDEKAAMNRLYAVESTPSNTGAMADHRLRLHAVQIEAFARALASALGVQSVSAGRESGIPSDWIPALARDLEKHRGASIVIAGDQQTPVVHALAHAMNQLLGNVGRTVIYTDPLEAEPVIERESLRALVDDMRAGRVDTLVVLGGNPLYDAPADLQFGESFLKVGTRIHLGLYYDETANFCHWHIPETHYLESWSDARAYDGTVSIIQPLIAPLYNGRSAHELLSVLLGRPGETAHTSVKEYWRAQHPGADFEAFWQTSLHDGVVADSALPAKKVSLKADFAAIVSSSAPSARGQGRLEIIFRPDPTVWDGRFANNGWLQELPKPFTKLTWDNAALVSVATAQRLGLSSEEVIKLRYRGKEVSAPVWVMPGHPDEAVTLHLGYGRDRAGRVGSGIGFNAFALRHSDRPWFDSGLEIEKTGDRYILARTQHHSIIESSGQKPKEEESVEAFRRDVIRVGTLEEYRHKREFAQDPEEYTSKALSLYPGFKDEGYAWGMSVDLNSCIGCNACVVACKSENNSPVVGKTEVHVGREMDWIRIDTYYRGDLENPEAYNQPVFCMHCENAPCEGVCPVGATVHSPEGLNEMIYNRCVGTRYCSNNCPYKVRRFNFRLYSDWTTPSLFGLRNPNVTVRSRGVMEKCTYCVQRINAVKIRAEEEDREVRDGEIQTACQQSCPAQAIVFGNINDPKSRVSKLKAQNRTYGMLRELNTRPRTTYLARLRNPN